MILKYIKKIFSNKKKLKKKTYYSFSSQCHLHFFQTMLSVPTCYMRCSCMLWGKATTVKTDLSSAEHETRISILFHLSHCTNILVLEPHFNHISRLTEGVPWRNVTRLWCIRKVVSYCMINSTFALARRCRFYRQVG